MKKSKIIKAIAAVATFATVFTTSFSSIASAYSLSMANATTINSDTDYNNALKVNIDNDGNLTYSEPASASTSPISSSAATGDWGDTKYDENRDFSWDDATVYFVMTDRFVNGYEGSNEKAGGYDHSYGRSVGEVDAENYATRIGTWHGGDLVGLQSKIDDGYFDNLGVNAIWLTAPYEQIHGAMSGQTKFKHYPYHGYWALDFTNMDQNIGSEDQLKDFITAAHKHGIRVIFDIVMNHAGYPDPVTANEYGFGKLSANWKKTYYETSESEYTWATDYAGESSNGMLVKEADWKTNYWVDDSGNKWLNLNKKFFDDFDGDENGSDPITYLSSGLPDFYTENDTIVGLPQILKNKWKKEGNYDEKVKWIDEYFNSSDYGKPKRTVRNYLVCFLSHWVEEYGVDGFRCDTAKHVSTESWATLKKACKTALNKWRQNNPNEPGAKWTDDFWMTGEFFDYKMNNFEGDTNSYFGSGAFDSMINFGFQGIDSCSGNAAIKQWQTYADKINEDSTKNLLSYISSHDKSLSGTNRITSGTMLLLTPGGSQIYYGDETSRPAVSAPDTQPTRSNMNWGSINKEVLAHWQKLGQFRANHLAVGAGVQTTIDDVTCGRTYTDKDGKTDKVVISLQTGTCKVNVKGFLDKCAEVRDAYTGETYPVDGDTVTVNAGSNGVILLEDTGSKVKKATVSASKAAGDYYEEDGVFDVTFSVKNAISATYTVDGGKEQTIELTEGTGTAEVQVGKDAVIGDSKTIDFTLTYKDADDKTQTIEKSFTYTKAETPVIKNLIIHFQDDSWNASTVSAWVYNSEKENLCTNKVWPGDALTKGDDGWYTIEYKTTDPYMVILSGGTGRTTPDGQDPTPIQGENWYYNGKWYTSDPTAPVKPTISSFKADKTSCKLGETIKFTTKATGESDLTYSYTVNGKEVEGATDSTFEFTPEEAGTYKVTVTVKDADGNETKSNNVSVRVEDGTVDPPDDSFTVTLKTDPTTLTQKEGTKITLSAVTSVKGDYTYTYYVDDEEVGTGEEFVWTPDKEGTYEVYVEAKNANNKTADSAVKTFKIVSKGSEIIEEKLNGVKLTADVKSPQTAGNKIVFTATPDGGSNDIQYTFIVNGVKVESDGNICPWTPKEAGKYLIEVEASDGDIIVTDQLIYNISKAQGNKFTLTIDTESSITEGTLINVKTSVKNENGEVTYSYYVKDSNGEVVDELENTNDTTAKLGKDLKAGTYKVIVKAEDEEGNSTEQTTTVKVTEKGGSSGEEQETFDGSNLLLMLSLFGLASVMMVREVRRKLN